MRPLAFLLLLLAPALAAAQGTGTIAGRVTDSTGLGLPGTLVLIDGTPLGAATDGDGAYRIIGVPVGTYDVTASFVGFKPVMEAAVEIHNGYTRTLDFMLEEGYEESLLTRWYARWYTGFFVDPGPFASRVLGEGEIGRLPVNR